METHSRLIGHWCSCTNPPHLCPSPLPAAPSNTIELNEFLQYVSNHVKAPTPEALSGTNELEGMKYRMCLALSKQQDTLEEVFQRVRSHVLVA